MGGHRILRDIIELGKLDVAKFQTQLGLRFDGIFCKDLNLECFVRSSSELIIKANMTLFEFIMEMFLSW